MEAWLSNLETLLLVLFAACALVGAVLVLVLREPMRVAMALISTMVFLDPRGSAGRRRFSSLLVPGVIACGLFIAALGSLVWDAAGKIPRAAGGAGFTLAQFSAHFLNEYWLEFELTSVLLLAAIVGAISVVQVSRRHHG